MNSGFIFVSVTIFPSEHKFFHHLFFSLAGLHFLCLFFFFTSLTHFCPESCWKDKISLTLSTASFSCTSEYAFFFSLFRRHNPLWVCIHSPLAGFSLLFRGFLFTLNDKTTVDRIPPDEWSVRRRDLYLTAHNTRNRQTSMPPVGFETTIPAGARP